MVTWVDAVAGDLASFQLLGELVGEEHVAQFAVAVGLEELPAEPASTEVPVCHQSLNTTPNSCDDIIKSGRQGQTDL